MGDLWNGKHKGMLVSEKAVFEVGTYRYGFIMVGTYKKIDALINLLIYLFISYLFRVSFRVGLLV